MKTKTCNHSCSPGDFYPGGKCGLNGCVEPPIKPTQLAVHLVSQGIRIRVDRTIIPAGWDPPPALVEEITREQSTRTWWSIPTDHPLAVKGDRVRVFQALRDRGIRWVNVGKAARE